MQVNNRPKGRVVAAQGPVVDVKFPGLEELPAINEVVKAATFDGRTIFLAVAEHLEDNVARCISFNSTLNLRRNSEVETTGAPLQIPVGPHLFGRIINIIGEPIDNKGEINSKEIALSGKDISRTNTMRNSWVWHPPAMAGVNPMLIWSCRA